MDKGDKGNLFVRAKAGVANDLLVNLNIDTYEPTGEDRFIKYKTFIDEFKLDVQSRPLKPLIKLNHLKSCVKGDAYQLIKSFNHAEQLNGALEALKNTYSKPDFVISEIYKNLTMKQSCTSFKNIKTLKAQVQTLKAALATPKTLGSGRRLLYL